MAHGETICAIATPPGSGGIGIIRVSGPLALAVAGRLVRLRCGRPLVEIPCRRLFLADVGSELHPEAHEFPVSLRSAPPSSTLILDTCLVVVMRAPHSYTGEDVVELHCHGGPALLRSVCEGLLVNGARVAEPGEFTRRAFLNGRIDLAQAEGVLDTIVARTTESLRHAQELSRGVFSQHIRGLQDVLVGILAEVEAGIDFVEEDLTVASLAELRSSLDGVSRAIGKLLSSWDRGRLLREGAAVVLVGCPNVGKSSLLNALVEYDRAIVTPIPGTTRDVLEEAVNLEGIPIRLIDTAGLRETDDVVEREGVRRTREAISEADLAIVVLDGSAGLSPSDLEVVKAVRGQRHLLVVNKADCPISVTEAELRALSSPDRAGSPLYVSARAGTGLDELRRLIVKQLPGGAADGEGLMITRIRHYEALVRARDAVAGAVDTVRNGLSPEFLAVDVRAATIALAELTGGFTTDDLLDQIFTQFCIGK